MKQRLNYSREVRAAMIVIAFAIEIQQGRINEMTAYAIAKKLGMRPSTHLNSILREMVASGQLDTYTRPNKGRWTTWYYCLPEGSYTPPTKARTATIKSKGKKVGQLELWR